MAEPSADGLVVVDKPSGWTSHDVVARIRRLAATRKVGHAGTLDPMATGVLVVGVNRATRLLGHLALTEKEYVATVVLGVVTSTDDADGDELSRVDAGGVTDAEIEAGLAPLRGPIEQVPSAVSAIKVDGRRAYDRVRSGEQVELAARAVTVSRLEVLGRDGARLEVAVTCSSGTYVRALARDLGAALGVGAHLGRLRRTRVGPFGLDRALTLDALAESLRLVPLADAVAEAFPRWDLDAEQARRLGHGQRLEAPGLGPGPIGAFGPGGEVVALVEERGGATAVLAGFSA